jgi:hypothetical protein
MKTGTTLEKNRIVKPVAVAVEGLDYLYTLLNQIKDDPRLQDVQLWDFKEDPNGDIGRWLKLFRTLDGLRDKIRAIGVIQDAEEDATGSFQKVAQALANAGLAAPTEPMKVTAGNPAIGVLVMPHDRPSGCLEHAMLEARHPDLALDCAEVYLRCVGTGNRNDNWQAKVKVHALIAAGDNPACTLSQSVAEGMWDVAHPSLKVMTDFLRLLCAPSTRPEA